MSSNRALQARFAAHDLLVGKTVTTTSLDLPRGVAQGVSSHGALRLATANGVHELSSGEVSVRVAASADGDFNTPTPTPTNDGASRRRR